MDEKEINEEAEIPQPLEVTIKKEKEVTAPSFDYDDYTPSDEEILDIETQISDKIKKENKNG